MGKTLSENLIFVVTDCARAAGGGSSDRTDISACAGGCANFLAEHSPAHIKPACCGIDKEYFRHQRDDWGETR